MDLRLDEVLLNSYLKIARKEDGNRLKDKIATLRSDKSFMDHKILTPLHKLSMILRKLPSLCNFENVERQLYSSISSCLATKATAVAYTPGSFGSSHNRCEAQAKEALQTAQNYLAKTGNNIVAFTDGSALGNPGPCGAGTAIFWKGMNSTPSLHKRPVSKLSSSYYGELQAIDLALHVICDKNPPIKKTVVHLVTDCQSALQASIKCNITGNFGQTLHQIEKSVTNLHKREVRTVIYWTAGHINLPGNELADRLAKEAATEARDTKIVEANISCSEIKNAFKKESQKRWQKRWDCGKDARFTHSLFPKVKTGGYKSFCEKSTETKLNRLQLGTTLLKDHMHKIMPTYYDSPNCDCEQDRATIEHFFLKCPLHNTQRDRLSNDIEHVLLKNTKRQCWDFSLQTLIGKPDDLTYDLIPQVRLAVASFIRGTATNI